MNKATTKQWKTTKKQDQGREQNNNIQRIRHEFLTREERTEAQTTKPPQDKLETNIGKEWKEFIKHTNDTLNQEELS